MKPDQKAELVAMYQDKLRTAMTGDGSNDCGALKQADIGLSLSSEAEATMAAPFTSASPSPLSLITLLREGRAALVTSFACFRYIVCYSMIQFISVEILYYNCATYGNWHYLIQDLLAVFPLAVVMSRTEAASTLCPQRPPGVLFSFKPAFSLLCQCVLILTTQLVGIFLLVGSPGFVATPVDGGDLPYETHETFFLQHLCMLQYMFVCFALSIGRPHRRPMWTNHWLVVLLVFLLLIQLWLMFVQPEAVVTFFEFLIVPNSISLLAFVLALVYGALSFAFEYWLSNTEWNPIPFFTQSQSNCLQQQQQPCDSMFSRNCCSSLTTCCSKHYETLE